MNEVPLEAPSAQAGGRSLPRFGSRERTISKRIPGQKPRTHAKELLRTATDGRTVDPSRRPAGETRVVLRRDGFGRGVGRALRRIPPRRVAFPERDRDAAPQDG